MHYANGKQMMSFKYDDAFSIDAFTCLKINIGSPTKSRHIFRSTEDFRRKAWYDWCMVSFDIEGENKINPSKILGFFHFDKNGGVRTKHLMEGYLGNDFERVKRVEQIKQNKIRDCLLYTSPSPRD